MKTCTEQLPQQSLQLSEGTAFSPLLLLITQSLFGQPNIQKGLSLTLIPQHSIQ